MREINFGLLMSALALMSAPSGALAQETCTTDTDCDHGYSCEEIGGDCASVACAPGEPCPEPEPCETTLGCLPVRDCTADSDCIDGWTCFTQTINDDCVSAEPAPACPDGEPDCEPEAPDPVDCGEPREESACIPRWQLPCEAAADCGPGFECVEQVWRCDDGSGSNPIPGAAPDAGEGGGDGFAPPPGEEEIPEDVAPPDCGEPSGEFYCQLIETTCSVDSDCGAGLSCQSFSGNGTCSGGSTPPSAGGAGSSGGDADDDASNAQDGGAPEDRDAPIECEQPEPTYACAPPSFQASDYYGGRGDAASGSDDDESGAGTNGDPTAEGGGEPTAAPVDSDDREDANATMSESSGCSAHGAHGTTGALFMVLAVLGLAVRRRSLRG